MCQYGTAQKCPAYECALRTTFKNKPIGTSAPLNAIHTGQSTLRRAAVRASSSRRERRQRQNGVIMRSDGRAETRREQRDRQAPPHSCARKHPHQEGEGHKPGLDPVTAGLDGIPAIRGGQRQKHCAEPPLPVQQLAGNLVQANAQQGESRDGGQSKRHVRNAEDADDEVGQIIEAGWGADRRP